MTPVNPPVITAEQHPTGNVLFYAGTMLIGEAALVPGVGDSAVATVFVPHLPAGAYVLTAQYEGDLVYGPAVSNSLNLSVEDFTVNCAVSNLNVIQGQTGSTNCAVTSLGGLSGPIQIVCAEQNPPTNGAIGCSFTPDIIYGTGTTTLTVVTEGGVVTENIPSQKPNRRRGYPPWPAAGGGIALALAGMLLSPIGRRARWLRNRGSKLLVLVVLLAGMAGAGLGCSNSVTLTNRGTPLGVHTMQITAAAYVNTVTVSHNAYLTVNVKPQ